MLKFIYLCDNLHDFFKKQKDRINYNKNHEKRI